MRALRRVWWGRVEALMRWLREGGEDIVEEGRTVGRKEEEERRRGKRGRKCEQGRMFVINCTNCNHQLC